MSLAQQLADIAQGSTTADIARIASAAQRLEAASQRAEPQGDILEDLQFTYFVSTTAQAIPSGVQTAINWDLQRQRTGLPSMDWSSAESSALHTLGAVGNRSYLAWGQVAWQANSSGFRTVVLERTDPAGGVSGDTITQMSASTGITVIPYVVRWQYVGSPLVIAELRATLDVLQDSGGALNVTFARLNVVKVF